MSICELKPVFKVLICINTKAFPSLCGNYLLACFCVTTKTDRKNCFQSDPFQSKGKIFLCFLFSVSLVAFSHCLYVLLPWWPPRSWALLLRGLCWASENTQCSNQHGPNKSTSFIHPGNSYLENMSMPKKKKMPLWCKRAEPGAFLEVLKRLRFLK